MLLIYKTDADDSASWSRVQLIRFPYSYGGWPHVWSVGRRKSSACAPVALLSSAQLWRAVAAGGPCIGMAWSL